MIGIRTLPKRTRGIDVTEFLLLKSFGFGVRSTKRSVAPGQSARTDGRALAVNG